MSKREIESVIGDPDTLAAVVLASFKGFTQRSFIQEFTDTIDGRHASQSDMRPMPVPVMLPV